MHDLDGLDENGIFRICQYVIKEAADPRINYIFIMCNKQLHIYHF